MNILICPDAFKHSLSAWEAGKNLASGIKQVFSDATVNILPLADGGEGTVKALVDATGGKRLQTRVKDPFMRQITASFGMLGDGHTAAIEMAVASGIELLKPKERNPLQTSSYGTGELIRAALDHQCTRIILGIGGSATIDGGAGVLAGLGATFLNDKQQVLTPSGGNLDRIQHINLENLDARIKNTQIQIGTDVDNPLTGDHGAAAVYGPQKGAGPEQVRQLEYNLKCYADVLEQLTGKNFKTLPGSGAAGGLAISLLAFTHASIRSGFQLVAEQTALETQIAQSDLIITGEGKIDRQTRYGKTAYGVAQLAKKHQKPVIAVAGTIGEGTGELYNHGFDLILPIIDRPMELQQALQEAPKLLNMTGIRIGRILKLNQ